MYQGQGSGPGAAEVQEDHLRADQSARPIACTTHLIVAERAGNFVTILPMELTVDVPEWAVATLSDLTDMARSPVPVDREREPRLSFELPDDTYFEYAFLDAQGKVRADPGNPVRVRNPWYGEVNAVTGPAYRADELADPPQPEQPLRTDRLHLKSQALGEQRRVTLTTPANAGDAPLPLVLAQDGVAFHRTGHVSEMLAALVRRGEARPALVAYVEPVDRFREYGFDPNYRRFITDELLPELRERHAWNGELIAMGASLGGLFSATLALERPDLVGTVVTLSGAFLGSPQDSDYYTSPESWVADALESRALGVQRWYAECGTFEWLLDVNRRVHDALQGAGVESGYVERHAGHNWTNWRNGMASALRFALPPAP